MAGFWVLVAVLVELLCLEDGRASATLPINNNAAATARDFHRFMRFSFAELGRNSSSKMGKPQNLVVGGVRVGRYSVAALRKARRISARLSTPSSWPRLARLTTGSTGQSPAQRRTSSRDSSGKISRNGPLNSTSAAEI